MNLKKYFACNRRVIGVIVALGAGIALGWNFAQPDTKAPASTVPVPVYKKVHQTIERKTADVPVSVNLTVVSLNEDDLLDSFMAPITNDSTLTALEKGVVWHNLVEKSQEVMGAYAASHHVIILSHKALIAPRVDVTIAIKKALLQAIQQAEEATGVDNPVDLAWVMYCQSPEFSARQNAHKQTIEESKNCVRVFSRHINQKMKAQAK